MSPSSTQAESAWIWWKSAVSGLSPAIMLGTCQAKSMK